MNMGSESLGPRSKHRKFLKIYLAIDLVGIAWMNGVLGKRQEGRIRV